MTNARPPVVLGGAVAGRHSPGSRRGKLPASCGGACGSRTATGFVLVPRRRISPLVAVMWGSWMLHSSQQRTFHDRWRTRFICQEPRPVDVDAVDLRHLGKADGPAVAVRLISAASTSREAAS